mmetsp:Transcript_20725/g.33540  ORF Transcript_20725/g.33540 Transcript_20725/m.33540 type:complete len:97 (+) Transcript_20725:358-648(+)|eukprot:CAMPEP_0169119962 /NCGR_PEP_ID=MMETSP1015-20121227/31844_1 /TAXON_ID=342587 /ORGANISM="Karlodinium micrum, Strain CCMP2283" /LENGTH=96 /DNA_ID=CAMNT_0009182893 /DNA_START=353 /DNA_END=643 /DNA_ORIENTATION=+
MKAWAEDQKTVGSLINLYADTSSVLTKALDVTLDHPGPRRKLGNPRCKRFSMLVKDCVVKTFNLASAEDDPAGDDHPDVSLVEKMLEDLKEKKDEL